MTKPAISVPGNLTLREVERVFFKYHIRHLLVAEAGVFLGVISRREFFQYEKLKKSSFEMNDRRPQNPEVVYY